jgi:hypothetical protein
MNRQAKNIKRYTQVYADTISYGTDSGYAEQIGDLHTIVESIRNEDGIQMNVVKVALTIRARGSNVFTIEPVAVQTAGTFSDTINLAVRVLGEKLAAAIDDVFGFDALQPRALVARRAPSDTDTAPIYTIETSMELPPLHRQILNKETESERLQNLELGFCGLVQASDTITYSAVLEIHYTERKKNIVLR